MTEQVPAGEPLPPNPGAAPAFPGVPSREDDIEEELWSGHYSGKAMVGMWVLGGVLTVVIPVLMALFAPDWGGSAWLIVAGVLAVLWLGMLLKYAYERLNARYRLTTQRFFHEAGILRRTTDRIEVIDMDDITFEQGIVERMLGVGTIKISSSDLTHPQLMLPGIDNVSHVAGLMDSARRKERLRRGIHIEAV